MIMLINGLSVRPVSCSSKVCMVMSINGLAVRLVSCLFWQSVHGHVNKWTGCKTGVMFVLAKCAWSCQ